MRLPKVIASSVIRSTQQGESHGGVYIVDFETEEVKQVLDWDKVDISWEGRGKDRGLRGIEFYGDKIFLAASDEIFVFDQAFRKIDSFSNKYLEHCHEICIKNGILYLTSTGYDSILEFDLEKERFTKGYEIRFKSIPWIINRLWKKSFGRNVIEKPSLTVFDPNSEFGPKPFDQLHINNVSFSRGNICVSGRGSNKLLGIKNDKISVLADISFGTHNAVLFGSARTLMNDTEYDDICVKEKNGGMLKTFKIPKYKESDLKMNSLPKDHARQGFGRGLTIFDNKYIIGGSSPATLNIYDIETTKLVKSLNITMDVRNAIHGLEIWPYE